jgi:hypothetical protein
MIKRLLSLIRRGLYFGFCVRSERRYLAFRRPKTFQECLSIDVCLGFSWGQILDSINVMMEVRELLEGTIGGWWVVSCIDDVWYRYCNDVVFNTYVWSMELYVRTFSIGGIRKKRCRATIDAVSYPYKFYVKTPGHRLRFRECQCLATWEQIRQRNKAVVPRASADSVLLVACTRVAEIRPYIPKSEILFVQPWESSIVWSSS